MSTSRHLVALRPLGLGDLLTALPALRALRDEAGDDGRVVVAAPRALEPLARLAGIDLVHAEELRPLARELHRADLLVNLHGRGPQSHEVALAACPRSFLAFAHPLIPESRGMPTWRGLEHEVDRWCRLLAEAGIPADPTDLRLAVPDVAVPGHAAGATVLHPGAKSAARRWPAERFAEVARAEREGGREVLVTGGPGEEHLAADIARLAGLSPRSVLAGRTSLEQLAGVVAHAGRVVCGDTGVAHLATAFGTPSVLLFGPTAPAAWGPRVDRDLHRVLWRGRRGNPHADTPDPGLLELDARTVRAELGALPSS